MNQASPPLASGAQPAAVFGNPGDAPAELHAARLLAADGEFTAYDFGDANFLDCGGWEYTVGGDEMFRPCYLTDDSAASDDAPSLKVTFTVRFEAGNAAVADAYVSDRGQQLGKRGAVPMDPGEHPAPVRVEVQRSSRAEVRNPMLAIPEVREHFAALPAEAREALIVMLRGVTKACRTNADAAYRKHKPPMYAYWKAMAVNARHLALAGARTLPHPTRSATHTIDAP